MKESVKKIAIIGVCLVGLIGSGGCITANLIYKAKNANELQRYLASEKEDERQTYLLVQHKATVPNALAEDIWLYSQIIKDPKVRERIGSNLNQTQAQQLSDTFYKKALAKQSPSAILQSAYDEFVKSTDMPEYDRNMYNVKVLNPDKMANALDKIIAVSKDHCQTRFLPYDSYPYFNNNTTASKIYEERFLEYLPIDFINLPDNSIAPYPQLHDRIDILLLRKRLECEGRSYSIRDLNYYFEHEVNYEAYTAGWHNTLRKQVFLATLAELLDKPELAEKVKLMVEPKDLNEFNIQKNALLKSYRDNYGKSMPIDYFHDS